MSVLDLQTELLQTEYPFLSSDHDPDIERYYDLRALGRSSDALVLYQSRLVPRYPDDQFRTEILRAYRTRSPRYTALLKQAYLALGQRVLERTKKLIKYIAVKADSFDETDVYSTIKTADAILALLPRERFEAVMAMERLHRYAQRLHYCEKSMAKAEALIRAYVTESLSIVEEERQRRKALQEQAQAEERRRLVAQDKAELLKQRSLAEKQRHQRELQEAKQQGALGKHRAESPPPQVHIDLNAIRFSAADIARIQIPPTLSRIEDKTLAFCFKYWNLVHDSAFERILFLYSRKYKTKHYEVFSAIQRGRLGGKRDEEILSSVMSILITGYYYSIQGDRYLQQQWALLKAKLEGNEKAGPEIAKRRTPPRRRTRTSNAGGSRTAGIGGTARGGSIAASGTAGGNARSAGRLTAQPRLTGVLNASETHNKSVSAAVVQEKAKHVSDLNKQKKSGSSGESKLRENPVRRNSVSERLMHLSGRSYDVYQDLFMTHVRSAIRRVLGKGRGIFFSLPQEAEDLVYDFLKRNYSNPYMNWEQSQERKQLEQLGFSIPAIEPIIDECYRLMGKN
ncbi:hypothetical protein [Gracilinema caldarium]|uniref:hypothetical protein n=1 Tax=Gracilinema caldarium TaxID=215591 RepID=UPI0026EA7D79|nr:hypothetical protein [Gracilinema caldarium]